MIVMIVVMVVTTCDVMMMVMMMVMMIMVMMVMMMIVMMPGDFRRVGFCWADPPIALHAPVCTLTIPGAGPLPRGAGPTGESGKHVLDTRPAWLCACDS